MLSNMDHLWCQLVNLPVQNCALSIAMLVYQRLANVSLHPRLTNTALLLTIDVRLIDRWFQMSEKLLIIQPDVWNWIWYSIWYRMLHTYIYINTVHIHCCSAFIPDLAMIHVCVYIYTYIYICIYTDQYKQYFEQVW